MWISSKVFHKSLQHIISRISAPWEPRWHRRTDGYTWRR